MRVDYYIASGFFNEQTLNEVKSIEKRFEDEGKTYFSPRSFSMDLSPNNPDREKNAKILFDKDLEMIHEASTIFVNIDSTYDIGTLFELGYAIGLILRGDKPHDFIEFNDHAEAELLLPLISMIINYPGMEELAMVENYDQYRNSVISINSVKSELEMIHRFYGILADFYYIPDKHYGDNDALKVFVDEFFKSFNNGYSLPIFVIDNRPPIIFIMMGLCRSIGMKFYTASIKNYGSNIMIASSSEGHLNLPSIVNPYKTNIVIE